MSRLERQNGSIITNSKDIMSATKYLYQDLYESRKTNNRYCPDKKKKPHVNKEGIAVFDNVQIDLLEEPIHMLNYGYHSIIIIINEKISSSFKVMRACRLPFNSQMLFVCFLLLFVVFSDCRCMYIGPTCGTN